jgi:hypothetical protein
MEKQQGSRVEKIRPAKVRGPNLEQPRTFHLTRFRHAILADEKRSSVMGNGQLARHVSFLNSHAASKTQERKRVAPAGELSFPFFACRLNETNVTNL